MAEIAGVMVRIGADTAGFKRDMAKTRKKVSTFQRQMKSLGGVIAGAFSVMAIANFGKAVIKKTAEFGKAMAQVKSISGASAEEFKRLTDNAKQLGASTEFTASEVAGLQKEYAKLGFSAKEILNATDATLDLATATGEDLARSAEVAGNVIRAFGFDAKDTGKVVDIMASSFTKSALDLERFSDSMKYVAPIAKAAGISIEETTSMMSLLADAGISGSIAGTALRKIFSELTNDGKPLADKLKELSEKGITLADANDEVGERAKAALLVLADQTGRIDELTGVYKDSAGAARGMADVQRDTLAGSFDKLKSAIEGAMLRLGQNGGLVKKMVDGLTDLISVNEDLIEKNKKLVEDNVISANKLDYLLSRYRELTRDGIKLTAQETTELNNVVNALKSELGDSIIYIDKETGALRLNTDAVNKNIQSRLDLASGGKRELLKTYAELQIALNQENKLKEESVNTYSDLREELKKYSFANDILTKNFKFFSRLTEKNAEKLREYTREVFSNTDATKEQREEAILISNYLQQVSGSYQAIIEKQSKWVDISKFDDIKNALYDLGVSIEEIDLFTKNYIDASENLNDEQKKQIDNYRNLVDASRDYTAALTDEELAALKKKQLELNGLTQAEIGQIDNYRNLVDASRDYTAALTDEEKSELKKLKGQTSSIGILEELDNQIAKLTEQKRKLGEEDKKQIARINDQIDNLKKLKEYYDNLSELDLLKIKVSKLEIIPGAIDIKQEDLDKAKTASISVKANYTVEDIEIPEETIGKAGKLIRDLFSGVISFKDLKAEDWAALVDAAAWGVGEMTNIMNGFYSNIAAKKQQELDKFIEQQELEKEALKIKLDEGLISEQKYNESVAEMDQEVAERKKKLAIQEARMNKATQSMNVIVNTAAGIMSALATYPPNVPLAIAIGSIGAAQLAIVTSAPLPSYAEGGEVKDKTLALVGDNPKEPEVGAPLKILKSIVNEGVEMGRVEVFKKPQIKELAGSVSNPYIVSPVSKITEFIPGITKEKNKETNTKELTSIIPSFSNGGAVAGSKFNLGLKIPNIDGPTSNVKDISRDLNFSVNIEVDGILRGEDIFLSNKRAAIRQNRVS